MWFTFSLGNFFLYVFENYSFTQGYFWIKKGTITWSKMGETNKAKEVYYSSQLRLADLSAGYMHPLAVQALARCCVIFWTSTINTYIFFYTGETWKSSRYVGDPFWGISSCIVPSEVQLQKHRVFFLLDNGVKMTSKRRSLVFLIKSISKCSIIRTFLLYKKSTYFMKKRGLLLNRDILSPRKCPDNLALSEWC